MTRLLIDASLPAKLQTLTEPAELCDDAGRVLGRYFPVLDPALYEPAEPQVSKEELDRRSRSKGKTYTTAEVIAYLEKL